MSDAVNIVIHSIQEFVESALHVVQSGVGVATTFVWGLLVMLWNTLERFAEFLGASVHFVLSNIVILILLFVGLNWYRNRSKSTGPKIGWRENLEK